MGRPIRYTPENGALFEVTLRTLQGRYLLRPDRDGHVNETVLGVLGRAQRLYGMSVTALSVLSNHLHILLFAHSGDQLTDFMRHVATNLSKEIDRLHDWPGRLWQGRYHAIRISDEEEAQVARLRYVLAAGVKEGLVDRCLEWPGVHSLHAILKGQPLRGWWFNRSKEFAARNRGRRPGRYDYATPETLHLEPLPCWRHLPEKEIRRQVRELVREVEREAAAERRISGEESVGAGRIMAADPHYRPEEVASSPAPLFHAFREQVREAMREAYGWVVAAHRAASERLRRGDRHAEFPEGTFPPSLPFVSFAQGPSG